MHNHVKWLTWIMASGMLICNSVTAAVWSITYPRPLTDTDKRNQYTVKLLELALDNTGVRYQLKPSEVILLPAKAHRQLKENRSINVLWSMTDRQRESELLPIRIPVAKGLIGWRVMLINQDDEARFEDVDSLRELQSLTPIQVIDWPDTKILQSNGFSVMTPNTYAESFDVLQQRNGDFFARSVIEVLPEIASLGKGSGIVLEKQTIIQYPAAMYFFVNKSNTTLAKLIETGLENIIKNGEFDRLFNSTFMPMLEQINVSERQVFRLSNPSLPDETPVNRSSLWFDVDSMQGQAQ